MENNEVKCYDNFHFIQIHVGDNNQQVNYKQN